MRRALGIAALSAGVACSSEARKLAEVDAGDSSGGFGAVASGGAFGSGGAALASGGIAEANGGTPIVIGGGGADVILATGGGTSVGGARVLTDQEHMTLVASACVGVRSEAEYVPLQLELVVDSSASMNEPAAGANALTKWQLTRDALLEAVVGMAGPGLNATASVGLLLYPKSGGVGDGLACIDTSAWVLRAPLGVAGSSQRTAIAERLLRVVPSGVTSTLDAYLTALDQGLLAQELAGQRSIMLVTDGKATSPECADPNTETEAVDPQPIVDEIASAYSEHSTSTVVVGTAGSEANRRWLSEAAVRGGTAAPGCSVEAGNCHIDLTTNDDLASALSGRLQSIAVTQQPCSFTVPPPPNGLSLANGRIFVVLNSAGQSALLPQTGEANCVTGWKFFPPDRVDLCPGSCAEAQGGMIEVLVDCAITAR